MADVKVSIVMSTIDDRAELLERSLWTYTKQDYSPIEVIVVADRPKSPRTKELVEGYQHRLDVKYFEIGGPPGWRNGYGQNKGIYESTGDILVITHPETMFNPNSVRATVERLNGEHRKQAMLMWIPLTETMTEWLGEHSEWRENIPMLQQLALGPLNKKLNARAKIVMSAVNIHRGDSARTFWQSAAMMRKTWVDIGGFTLMNSWGSMDEDHLKRKKVLGIGTRVVRALSYHQYHPFGPKDNKFEVFEYKTRKDATRELKWG